MLNYLILRIFYGLLVLLTVIVIISGIIYMTPVDPARLSFGQRLDTETVELKRRQLGLDQSLTKQITMYLTDISPVYIGNKNSWKGQYRGIKISFGRGLCIGLKWPWFRESYQSGRKVSEILSESFFNTFILATAAMILAIAIGLVLGVFASLKKGTLADHAIVGLSTFGYSVPSYVTAIVLGIIFGFYLKSFTGLNIQGSLFELNDLGDEVLVVKNLLLPAVALGIRPVAIITQLMRSSMLQVMNEKFVLVARSKGLSTRRLVMRHILRNALNPVITALSGWFASLLAGAFFVEYIFNFKGLGFVTVTALLNYDIPVILGALLLTCGLFIIINLVVDLSYRWVDPRVRIENE